jgi:hypothetical protein
MPRRQLDDHPPLGDEHDIGEHHERLDPLTRQRAAEH